MHVVKQQQAVYSRSSKINANVSHSPAVVLAKNCDIKIRGILYKSEIQSNGKRRRRKVRHKGDGVTHRLFSNPNETLNKCWDSDTRNSQKCFICFMRHQTDWKASLQNIHEYLHIQKQQHCEKRHGSYQRMISCSQQSVRLHAREARNTYNENVFILK